MARTLHEIRLEIYNLSIDFFVASSACEFRCGAGCSHKGYHADFALGNICELEHCPVVHESFIRFAKEHKDEEPRCICNWFPGYSIYCSTHKGSQGG